MKVLNVCTTIKQRIKAIELIQQAMLEPGEEADFRRSDGFFVSIVILDEEGQAVISDIRKKDKLYLDKNCPATSLFTKDGDKFFIKNLLQDRPLKILFLTIKDTKSEEGE